MKRQRKKKRSGGRVLLVFLLAAAVMGLLWAGSKAFDKLTHYGESATVTTPEQEPQRLIVPEKTEDEGLLNGVPVNRYDPTGFSEENGFFRYEKDGVTSRIGVDVSSHQQQIDWEKVRAAGVDFAVIRVGYRGYTEGKLQEDAFFRQNMEQAAAAGLDLGVYFFSQAISIEEAVEEADFVLELLKDYDLQLPVYFDWEDIEAEARSDAMNRIGLTGCAFAFCSRIEAGGREAGIYFNQVFGYQELNLYSLQDYDFWLAEYNPTPSFQYDFTLWQYSNCGNVDGIDTDVDLNLLFVK